MRATGATVLRCPTPVVRRSALRPEGLLAFLATLLRFIPYLGPVIAAVFPLTLAFVVDPGCSMLLWTLVLILTIELLSNNIVEPWLYGSSTGMTPMAVILSAIFWTLLWGTPGLILATPLTMCLVVTGRYVPRLAFIEVLLGSEPVLSPPERLYQRMLAGDPEEGREIAEELLEDRPLAAFYDEVALPALRLAEADRRRQALAGERRALCVASFVAVVDELGEEALGEAVEAVGEQQDALRRGHQQILGSGSPTSMSSTREPPIPVRSSTIPTGSGSTAPTMAA